MTRWVKILAITLLAVPFALGLAKCASTRLRNDAMARGVLERVSHVRLPADAIQLQQGVQVGAPLSGTGSAVDALAYLVFASELPPQQVFGILAPAVDDLRAETGEPSHSGLFQWDSDLHSRAPIPELILRRHLKIDRPGVYVLYSGERLDDGTWDWRGW